jgi:hypothetical protein
MKESDFLRQQGETCFALSQSTYDLTIAGRLRALAQELRDRATELDKEKLGGSTCSRKRNVPPDSAADQ